MEVLVVFALIGVLNLIFILKRKRIFLKSFDEKYKNERKEKKYIVVFAFVSFLVLYGFVFYKWGTSIRERGRLIKEQLKQEEEKKEEGFYILKPEDLESDDE